jgi:hypothetical protein
VENWKDNVKVILCFIIQSFRAAMKESPASSVAQVVTER